MSNNIKISNYLSPYDETFVDASTYGGSKYTNIKQAAFTIGFFIGVVAFLMWILYYLFSPLFSGFSNNLIEKYENMVKSNFTNKDQIDFSDTSNDYDIHYLVEQMIYKEFTPIDKKKYLNLPEALKDSLLKDYLIQKI